MKTRISLVHLITALGAISSLAVSSVLAEDSTPAEGQAPSSTAVVVNGAASATPTAAQAPAAKETAPPKLPYGVEDILKLNRAQVSEEITLSYIQNSGTIYDLRPNDIVYLKEQGVSDKVVNAMMEQRKKATEAAAQTPAPAVQQQQPYADASSAVTAPLTPIYTEAAPAYVEPSPAFVPASSVYVIPYPAASYAYSGYYRPYYGSSYYCSPYRYYGAGYCAPSVVFRFGVGGHGYSHGHSFHHR